MAGAYTRTCAVKYIWYDFPNNLSAFRSKSSAIARLVFVQQLAGAAVTC